ncbi:MAG: hypothetical protein Q7J98_10175 [Kiritimatiellia bacterium]|nr:hypothetical protein [Kiritimatiellia bacterium]
MRRIISTGVGLALFAIVIIGCGRPASADENNMFSIGGRYHEKQTAFDDLPFGNGDISYPLLYSYLWQASIWQLGLDIGPDISGRMPETGINVDFALTPQFNLIFCDRYFRGGGGIRTSYLRGDDGEGKWLSLYWQLQLGLSFPIYKTISVDIGTYYVMEEWSKIGKFRFNDLEYGLLINYAF